MSSKNLPSITIVGIALAVAALFQFPVYFLIRADHIFTGIIFNELIVMAGVPLAVISILHLEPDTVLKFRRIGIATLLIVIIMTVSADIVIECLSALSERFFPLPEWMERISERLMSVSGAQEFVWKLFLLCVLPAVSEEIFFRGFCQTSIAARWGNRIAIVITAALFAAFHLNPWQFHIYFILGIFLGWIYSATGTLWTPILVHFINNLWTFATHLFKVEFPLGHPCNWVGWTILGACAVVFLVAAVIFRKISDSAPL